ncbi:MAG: hypothetical protein ACRDSP_06645 [Pseudonocardiaceae bacterium]
MSDHHRLVDDMICCCGWEYSPQAFHWSGELPVVSHTNEPPAAPHATDHHDLTAHGPALRPARRWDNAART